jgi:hypothetical protein
MAHPSATLAPIIPVVRGCGARSARSSHSPLRARALLVSVLLLGFSLGLLSGCDSGTTPTTTPSAASTTSTPSPTPATTTSPPDPTAGWTAYSDTTDRFSLRYPPSWVHRTCVVSGHTSLYLAPSTAALGVCSSGFVGQMYVIPFAGDQRSTLVLGSDFTGLVNTPVTVAGVAGQRESATVATSMGIGPVPGTKVVQFLFFTNGRTYLCRYNQAPSGPTSTNVQADFELMVTSTLAFTP